MLSMFEFVSLTSLWTYIYNDIFLQNDFVITLWGTLGIVIFWFWFWGLLLMYTDLTGKPAWMLQYKVQPGSNTPVDRERLWAAIKVVLFNDILVGIPYMVLLYPLQQYMGCTCRPEDLPSILRVIRDVIGFMVMEEIWFYYSHRLFHWAPLYRHIHKKHHEWTAPIGLVASYAHPLEHMVSNLTPLFIGPLLMSTHLATLWAWLIVAQTTTVFHHSGYDVPYMPSPLYHDYHHQKFNGNYGGGILDRFHGTDLGLPGQQEKQKK